MNRELAVQNDNKTDSEIQWAVPAIDILERSGDLRLVMDMPGVAVDALKVSLEEGRLQVAGTRTDHPDRGYRRSFRLPESVDADAIEAAVDQGVLTVTLPALASSRPRAIPVQVR